MGKLIDLKLNWIDIDIGSLPARSPAIPINQNDHAGALLLLYVDHDVLAGAGGSNVIVTPKQAFQEDYVAAHQLMDAKVFDEIGFSVATSFTISGLGAVGAYWRYIISGSGLSKQVGDNCLHAPYVFLEFNLTGYTSGQIRMSYQLTG